MSDASFGLNRIGQINICAKDLARAVGFYRDVLKMKFLFQFPGMAFFDCGGIRLYLSDANSSEADQTSIVYYRVDSIDEATAVLQARGVVFVSLPQKTHEDAVHELWLAFFKDSEGNHLGLMCEMEKMAA